MNQAELITVAEIQTWDEFPIQLVTSVCQLSTFNRCQNIITTLSRQAPLFAFGTAAGEIAIMQVAPCKVTDHILTAEEEHQQQGGSGANGSASSGLKSSSNQRAKAKARRDALKAGAKVDRVGFFSLPQPSLPGGGSNQQHSQSRWSAHKGNDENAASPNFASTSSPSTSNPPSAATFSHHQQHGHSSPTFVDPNAGTSQSSFIANNNNNNNFLSPKSAHQAIAANQASGGSWAVTQLSYSPFSNTLYCLCGGTIYILLLVADDSQAISTISGHTEQRYLRCVIVGQLPSPAQARGDQSDYYTKNRNNNDDDDDANDQKNSGRPREESPSSSKHQQQHHSNNAWLYFTIHSSLTEVKVAAFTLNQVSCFVVDTKPLAVAQNQAAAAASPTKNPEQFLPSPTLPVMPTTTTMSTTTTGSSSTTPSGTSSPPLSGAVSSNRRPHHNHPAYNTTGESPTTNKANSHLSYSARNNQTTAMASARSTIEPVPVSRDVRVEINCVNTFRVKHSLPSSLLSSSGFSSSASPTAFNLHLHNSICSCWCGPLLVCNSGQHYNFYAPEFSKPVRSVPATKEAKFNSSGSSSSTSAASSIFREKQSAISMRCIGLYDSFHMGEGDFSEEAPGVALLITEVADGGSSAAAADVALPFYVQIWMYESGDVVKYREIPCLFTMSSSVHLASTGPWLLVMAADGGGVDVHNWQTGSHVQSCAEEFANDFSITQNLSSIFNRSSAVVQPFGKQIMWKSQETKRSVQDLLSKLYVERSTDIIIGGAGKMLILQFESPRAALTQITKATSLVEDEDVKNEEMMSLQMFAVSIGSRGGLFADDATVGKTVHAVIPDGYDELLQSFAHILTFGNNRIKDNNNNRNKTDEKVCFTCKQSFGFLTKRHFLCNCCLRHFCERCAPIRESNELIKRGVTNQQLIMANSNTNNNNNDNKNSSSSSSSTKVRICSSCLQRLDENMFNLLLHGKYREALHYLTSARTMEARNQYPELYGEFANMSFTGHAIRLEDLREFHLPHIDTPLVDEILWRCIHSGKLALCAQLLPMACGTDEARWQHFVMFFLTDADAAMSLANNIPHHQLQTSIGKFVYSSILIALVKYSPILLTHTLGKWPPNFYSAALVTSAIESSLKSKLENAMSIQRECQVGGVPVIWDSPWNWNSIGELYIDEDVKTLVSAYLMLCKKKKMYVEALKMHLNFFEKYLPHISPFTTEFQRERGGTTFEKKIPIVHHQNNTKQKLSSSTSLPSSARNGFDNNDLFPDQQYATPRIAALGEAQQQQQPYPVTPVTTSTTAGGSKTTSSYEVYQLHSTTRDRFLKNSVSTKFSPLINTFEWILNYNMTDLLLRPGERLGGGGTGSGAGGGGGVSHGHYFVLHYDGPSLLPLVLQIWRMDAVQYLLQWPELTSRPDVIDSLVQQIMEIFNIGKDGLPKTSASSASSNNKSDLHHHHHHHHHLNNYNTNNNPTTNLMSLVGSGGREYSRTQQPSLSGGVPGGGRREVLPTPPVGQENDGPVILQTFLHEITSKDVGATMKHHNLLACLYVHHAPHLLLDFLREPTVTSLDYAKLSQLVRQKRMFGELAYIMGRSGDASEAIRLVVRCLRDVEFAIQFVEDTDEQLWDELIKHVLQSPALIGNFLDHAIGHYDMAKFLDQIPARNRLKVPNAPLRLGRVIVEQAIDTALNQTSLDSYNTENFNIFKDHYRQARGAIRFSRATLSQCSACGIGIDLYKTTTTTVAPATVSTSSSKNKNNAAAAATVVPTSVANGNHVVFNVSGNSLLHPSCAEPQCGAIPEVSYETSKLMLREKQRKRAWKMERDPARQMASIEVYRDSEVFDICEILPKPLRFEILSYLNFNSLNICREVSRSWYLHVRALECGWNILHYNNSGKNVRRVEPPRYLRPSSLKKPKAKRDSNKKNKKRKSAILSFDSSSSSDNDSGADDGDDFDANNEEDGNHNNNRDYSELQPEMDETPVYGFGLEHRTAFQQFQWFHGTYPSRRPPFGSYEEGGTGEEECENVFSNTFGLRIGGQGAMSDRLNPPKRGDELLVPVGNDNFVARSTA